MKYKILGKTGLRVSEVCLGTMTFGEDWGWGATKDTCSELVNMYLEAGGNFIDSANYYTNGSSETILGEILKEVRDKVVLATKYSLMTDRANINSGGNQRKNMFYSVEQSLRRLKTDYIDLYWVHIWDKFTPIEEVMRGLEDLVRTGKVLHTGISDIPAWVVAKANTLAAERDWNPFSAIQVEYNLLERASERELLPMAEAENLSVLAWSPLAGGLLSGKYNSSTQVDQGRLKNNPRLTTHNLAIADKVIEIANELNVSPSTVALAWIKKNRNVIPILGARKPEQLKDNLQCINISLGEDHLTRLEKASQIKLGFPHDFINSEGVREIVYGTYKNKIIQ